MVRSLFAYLPASARALCLAWVNRLWLEGSLATAVCVIDDVQVVGVGADVEDGANATDKSVAVD